MTSKQINSLIRHFKELVELDINGITSSDARNTVTDWLEEIDPELAHHFHVKVLAYQSSPKIVKMENEYMEQNR